MADWGYLLVTHHAKALFAVTLYDWEEIRALFPYHIYTEETLKERFDWEGKGMAAGSIHLAFVKTSCLEEPIELTYEKRFGGCRSWLEIPEIHEPDSEEMVPVLETGEFERLQEKISSIVGSERVSR